MVLNLCVISCWASEKSPLAPENVTSQPSQVNSDDPQLIKIIQIPVTIYRDRCAQGNQPAQYDKAKWAEIVNNVRDFERGKFSLAALNRTIAFMVDTSIPAEGIWGSSPVLYIKDSEMIDGPKK